jgi:hypothetical protein
MQAINPSRDDTGCPHTYTYTGKIKNKDVVYFVATLYVRGRSLQGLAVFNGPNGMLMLCT